MNRPNPGDPDFEAMADKAFDELPEPFRSMAQEVVIRVADFAAPEVLNKLGIESRYNLLGLYQGVDRTRRSIHSSGNMPDMVWLYRQPILNHWRRGEDSLYHVVRHVLVHEIGHHFGLSDDDMYGLEDEAYREERGCRADRI